MKYPDCRNCLHAEEVVEGQHVVCGHGKPMDIQWSIATSGVPCDNFRDASAEAKDLLARAEADTLVELVEGLRAENAKLRQENETLRAGRA